MRRWLVGLTVTVGCAAALVACSSDKKSTTSGSSDTTTAPDPSSDDGSEIDWCSTLEVAEIEEQFGAGGTVLDGQQDDLVDQCQWDVGEDQSQPGTGTINVGTAVGAQVMEAEEYFATIKESAIDPVEVDGVGDEAFYEPTLTVLTVRTGDTVYFVQAAFLPEPENTQTKLEALALAVGGRV